MNEIGLGELSFRLHHEDSTYTVRKDSRWSSDDDPIDKSEDILFNLGGTFKKDTILLGKPCKTWIFNKNSLKELWTWNGLVLKRVVEIGDQIIEITATKIDLEGPINPNNFIVPEFYSQKK